MVDYALALAATTFLLISAINIAFDYLFDWLNERGC